MNTKKPDSKSIVYYQAVTAGIRNAARSRFIFRLTLTCLFLQPCDLLCLFQGLTFKQRKPANADVYGLFQTPRVGLEPTTPRLTAVCSTIELSRIILFSSVCDHNVALPLSYRGLYDIFIYLQKSIQPDNPSTFFFLVKPSTD